MKKEKQKVLDALMNHYKQRVDFLVDKKTRRLEKLVEESEKLKIKKIKEEIGKPKKNEKP